MTPVLEFRGLTYRAGDFRLGPVALAVEEGTVVSIIGPNGAGKTSLLRLAAGLERPEEGHVLLRGSEADRLPPERREIGFVFQDLALFPHLTAAQNIEYGLWVRKTPPDQRVRRVEELATDFGLASCLDRLPSALSGGEMQRVAIARALAPDPAVLLLDEPLHSIDPENRRHFLTELKRILRVHRVTVLHVTHDLDEGAFLSDEVAVLIGGRIAQQGPTQRVLQNPATVEVARFLGYNAWQEGSEWCATHPSTFTLERVDGDPGIPGVVTSMGTTMRGTLIEVKRAEGNETFRVELDRHLTEAEALSTGQPTRLWARRTLRFPRSEPPSG